MSAGKKPNAWGASSRRIAWLRKIARLRKGSSLGRVIGSALIYGRSWLNLVLARRRARKLERRLRRGFRFAGLVRPHAHARAG